MDNLEVKTYLNKKIVGNKICAVEEGRKQFALSKQDLKMLDLGLTVKLNLNHVDYVTLELV